MFNFFSTHEQERQQYALLMRRLEVQAAKNDLHHSIRELICENLKTLYPECVVKETLAYFRISHQEKQAHIQSLIKTLSKTNL